MARETVIGKLEPIIRGLGLDDLRWVLEKAELALDLDPFVTTQADRDRLARIKDELT